MTTLPALAQSLSPDAIISLFWLDTSPLGGPTLRFVAARDDTGPVVFDGNEYTPTDIEFSGLEVNGQGALPTPTIKLANTSGVWQSMINTYGDLLGCKLYRMRTHARFLDTGSEPDPLAFYGPDVFSVERKVSENPLYIEWQLSAAIDQEGVMLPRRTVIRNTCLWRYRTWNTVTEEFDYSNVTCPYAAEGSGKYFDINDQPVTDPADDVPSRRKSCCTTRFGAKAPLPFGGFPGVSRSL